MYANERERQPPEENIVVGYVNGKAIMQLKAYPGHYFYDEIAYPYVTIGEHLVEAQPKPIELLPVAEQAEIISQLEAVF